MTGGLIRTQSYWIVNFDAFTVRKFKVTQVGVDFWIELLRMKAS